MDGATDIDRGDQAERGRRFRELHGSGTFVLPCAWDAGSARIMAAAGAAAIGTTSGGINWDAGRPDDVYAVERDEMLAADAAIAAATDLPTSGDLEDGYGATPDEVAATMRAESGATPWPVTVINDLHRR